MPIRFLISLRTGESVKSIFNFTSEYTDWDLNTNKYIWKKYAACKIHWNYLKKN